MHQKNKTLVITAFQNDAGFVKALDKASERFINRNAVTELANNVQKSPELLARYCDLLLRKSSKDVVVGDLDDTLTQVVSAAAALC